LTYVAFREMRALRHRGKGRSAERNARYQKTAPGRDLGKNSVGKREENGRNRFPVREKLTKVQKTGKNRKHAALPGPRQGKREIRHPEIDSGSWGKDSYGGTVQR